MYDLGEQFRFDVNKAIPNAECTFVGNKYRITILTERLVRLEYNESGYFENSPTELVWYRNLPKPVFSSSDKNGILKISTKYFELSYKKDKPFDGGKFTPTANLKISLLNTQKVWYYNHPEAKNLGTIPHSVKNKKFVKGLFSLDGFASIDDSKSLIMQSNGSFKPRENEGIDIYVFLYGRDFYFCLNDYFAITGNPPLLPRYALGNWWCKSDSYGELDLSRIINKFERKNIPISIFMLDNWKKNNTHEFSEIYKEPRGISSILHNKKIRMGLVLDNPVEFYQDTSDYEKLKSYIPNVEGKIPFDLFDAKSIDAYLKLLIHPLNQIGVDLYFLNENEKRNFLLKHYLFYDYRVEKNKRNLISGYNSMIASHRYPVLYSGKTKVDWSTLKTIVKYNILASNIGVSFLSHDLGGTSDGVEDSELFIRFVQLGVFSPITRLGSNSGKYYKREPWRWDFATCSITTEFLNLRYKLIPYIYTECYKYHKYGKPLIEPLYNRYPVLYDDDLYCNEYFFGNNILVSPILNKKDSLMNRVIHKMYIPEGVWYDMFNGKKYTGGRRYVSFYKENEYPVFVKAGTILPMSLNHSNDTSAPKKLEILIYPGYSNTYSVYEDDGISNNYKNGDFIITNIEYVYRKDQYKVTIMPVSGKMGIIPETRDYKILFKNTKIPSSVECYIGNGKIVNKAYKEDENFAIEVENIPTNAQLTVVCKGECIEVDAINIINEDIASIINDLPIKTIIKQKIDEIMFSKQLNIKKKRIEIRKLANIKYHLERKYMDLFLKLLEYIENV